MMRLLWLAMATMIALAAPSFAGEKPKGFILHSAPKELPDVAFRDGDDKPLSLSRFRGKVVLLNVWATWCPPCRHEMPTLDRLQGKLGGPAFEVVALSIDRAGAEKVREFFAEIDVKNLDLYIDPSGKAARELQAFGLPVTLLLDREGSELGRLIGPAEWDTPEMIGFLNTFVERPDHAAKEKTP